MTTGPTRRGAVRALAASLFAVVIAVPGCALGAGGRESEGASSPRFDTVLSVSLRVMTYNIAAGGGDLARIERTIRGANPDVVALQEVDVHWSARSNFVDQATMLATALGMDARFAPIYRLPNAEGTKPMREYGLAVLSRLPIVASRNHAITRLSTQEADARPAPAPGFLDATIDVRGTRVRVFNTHLDYRADPATRIAQVAEMLAIIGDAGPAVLLGDLNATPEAPELQPLFQRLRDLWPAAAGPGFSYPATAPTKRIDYVLGSWGVSAQAMRVVESPASDHRAVVADLMIVRR